MYGEGNAYDFGARIQDPRLGRFFTLDPLALKFPGQSPYLFAANSPVSGIDEDGKIFSPQVQAIPRYRPVLSTGRTPINDYNVPPELMYAPYTGGHRVDIGEDHGWYIETPNGGFYMWDQHVKRGPMTFSQGPGAVNPYIDARTGDDYTPYKFKVPTLSLLQNSNRVQEREDEKEDTKNKDVFYVTYTLTKNVNGKEIVYSGRTRGYGEMTRANARKAVLARFNGHHKRFDGFDNPTVDETSRSYAEIRGREQQLIDSNGGAMLDTNPQIGIGPGTSGNEIRGVGRQNPNKKEYHKAASGKFGEKFKYTGG